MFSTINLRKETILAFNNDQQATNRWIHTEVLLILTVYTVWYYSDIIYNTIGSSEVGLANNQILLEDRVGCVAKSVPSAYLRSIYQIIFLDVFFFKKK